MVDQRKKRKTSAVHLLETFVVMLMDDNLLVIQNIAEGISNAPRAQWVCARREKQVPHVPDNLRRPPVSASRKTVRYSTRTVDDGSAIQYNAKGL